MIYSSSWTTLLHYNNNYFITITTLLNQWRWRQCVHRRQLHLSHALNTIPSRATAAATPTRTRVICVLIFLMLSTALNYLYVYLIIYTITYLYRYLLIHITYLFIDLFICTIIYLYNLCSIHMSYYVCTILYVYMHKGEKLLQHSPIYNLYNTGQAAPLVRISVPSSVSIAPVET